MFSQYMRVDCAAGYGDWVCVDSPNMCWRTPSESVSAFYFVQGLGFLAEIADIIGKNADAELWTAKHATAVAAYHTMFYNSTVGG